MPETSMNKQNCMILGKYEIGFSGNSGIVKTVAKPEFMNHPAQKKLRLCIATPDAAHHAASGGFIYNVCHGLSCKEEFLSFTVFPIPLEGENIWNHDARHLRHNRNDHAIPELFVGLCIGNRDPE